MIAVHSETVEPVRRYGLGHFLSKFNIQTGESEVALVYGDGKAGEKNIVRVQINEMGERLEGAIHIGGETYPIFETPKKIEIRGEVIAHFSNGLDEYPVIVRTGDGIEIGFDIFNEVGHLLSGFMERYWPASTKVGDYLARTPVVDIYEKILMDCIKKLATEANINIKQKELWPGNKRFALGLSHDVDLYRKTIQYFSHFTKHVQEFEFRESAKQVRDIFRVGTSNPYWNFDKMMAIEESFGVKSSIYFLDQRRSSWVLNLRERLLQSGACNFSNPEIRRVIKQVSDNGWEVGLHQSFDSYKNEKLLKREKEELEKITKKEITGVRQHYLKVDIPDIWLAQGGAGFSYDSTIGFTTTIGFRAGTSFPFMAFDAKAGKELNLLEIPLIIMEREVLAKDSDPWDTCRDMIDTIEKYNGLLTILWHQRFFNEDEFPGYAELYKKIIEYCQKRGAWVAPLDEIYRWWVSR